jgi:predicted transcriptional regulator
MQGWVKIHRQIKDKAYYKDSEFIHLWIHLILCANHCNGEYLNGYEIIKLKKGQFVTGRKKLSQETGISESKIERILKVFESEQQIEQQTNSRSRLISILSWDKYQETEQQTNNKRTANEQQVNTNNNDNNYKNENNNVFSFNEFWEVYPNKTAKAKCKPKFDKLTNSEKEQIKNTIEKFISYKPFPNYNHPNPETYLNQKRWEDVIPEAKKETEFSDLDAINEARQNWIKKNLG